MALLMLCFALAVFAAFGCGAFENPAHVVAREYRQALEKRAEHFDLVVWQQSSALAHVTRKATGSRVQGCRGMTRSHARFATARQAFAIFYPGYGPRPGCRRLAPCVARYSSAHLLPT